jgi:NADPH:quinone reductase-like Zn-dependent oxidoreductase
MPVALPTILGKDVSGTVAAVGPHVTDFVVGDQVLGFVNHGYAELVVARVESWAKVPARLDLVDAAALPLVALTGAQLVEEAAGVRDGQTVLVTGATGAVGRVAVFVAKARGAKVLAGVRGTHAAEAEAMGVRVVALDDERAVEAMPPLDALADTVGGATTQRLLGKVKRGGAIGSVVGEPAGAKERGLVVKAMLTHPDPKRLALLAAAAGEGRLVVPIAAKLPFTRAAEAHRIAERGGTGKVLLTP